MRQPINKNRGWNIKWFKHDTDAHADAKLRKVMIKYGARGYGLYWYCLEAIAREVTEHNLTFELEHDSEVLAHDLGMDSAVVEEMMRYMVSLGLFEDSNGRITCLKMLKRLDQSMTSNPRFRRMLTAARDKNHDAVMTNHDAVMTGHDSVMLDKTRQDKNRNKYKGITLPEKNPELSEMWCEFIDHRRALKKPLTQQAFDRFVTTSDRVASELGLPVDLVIHETIDAGWQSVKADWLRRRLGANDAARQRDPEKLTPAERVRAKQAVAASGASPVGTLGANGGDVRPPLEQSGGQ